MRSLSLLDTANVIASNYFRQAIVESLFNPNPIWERLMGMTPTDEADWIVEDGWNFDNLPLLPDGSIDFDRVEL